MARKIKTGDRIVVVSKGELKLYEAKPRTLEAEAGLKEYEVKLDLIRDEDYIAAHKKISESVSDEAGRFKNAGEAHGVSVGEDHNLEEEIENRLLRLTAEDIDAIAAESNAKIFLTVPETVEKELMALLDAATREKIIKTVPKDLIKTDKEELLERINEA